jgi:hypothetical protein
MPRKKSPLAGHEITISAAGHDPVTLTGEQFEQLPEAIAAGAGRAKSGFQAFKPVPETAQAIFDEVRAAHHASLAPASILVLFAGSAGDGPTTVKLAPDVVIARDKVHAWVLVNPDWYSAHNPEQLSMDEDADRRRLVVARAFDEALCGLCWTDKGKLARVPAIPVRLAIVMRYGLDPLSLSGEGELAEVLEKRRKAKLSAWEPLPEEPGQ